VGDSLSYSDNLLTKKSRFNLFRQGKIAAYGRDQPGKFEYQGLSLSTDPLFCLKVVEIARDYYPQGI